MIIHDPSRIEDKETWNHATINQFLTAFWKGHKFPLRSASLEEVQVSFPANSLKRSTPWFHFLGFLCLPVSCLSRSCVTALRSVLLWQRVSIAFLLKGGSLVQAKNDYGLFTLPAYPLEPRLQCSLLWMMIIISNSSKDSCSYLCDLQVSQYR